MTFLKKIGSLTGMSIDKNTDESAIGAALAGDWKEAIRINNELLKINVNNIDIFNRLGYAYLKTGQISKARDTYQKVLDLDPYNQIALKNTKLLSLVKRKNIEKGPNLPLSPLQFLEDPGKTKLAACVNLAPAQALSMLSPGQEVYLRAKNHCVELRTDKNTYLAALPDDISFKLNKLLAAGNTYQVIVKGVSRNTLFVIIRELTRGKRFANQPSFISATATSYMPFSRPEGGIGEKTDSSAAGEEEDANADDLTEGP